MQAPKALLFPVEFAGIDERRVVERMFVALVIVAKRIINILVGLAFHGFTAAKMNAAVDRPDGINLALAIGVEKLTGVMPGFIKRKAAEGLQIAVDKRYLIRGDARFAAHGC